MVCMGGIIYGFGMDYIIRLAFKKQTIHQVNKYFQVQTYPVPQP